MVLKLFYHWASIVLELGTAHKAALYYPVIENEETKPLDAPLSSVEMSKHPTPAEATPSGLNRAPELVMP